MFRNLTLWCAYGLMLFASSVKAERVSFKMIPSALGASDMSPDGRFIVGDADVNGDFFPDGGYILDTTTNTMTLLPTLGLNALAVSDDGSVVVGDIPDPTGIGSNVAGRWTAATGWQSLGHLPNAGACPSRSDGYEVSADGSVVVGLSWDGCSGRGFRWTAATGMQELQNLANGNNRASVVSSDGSLIGGFAQGSFERTPAVWNASLAGQLLDPPNGDAIGEIHGIRDDGSVLLGEYLTTQLVTRATKWTATQTGWQPETIGAGSRLPGWSGIPQDIADNDTVVGFDFLIGNRRAWIQPEGTGPLIDLRSYVEAHGGSVPANLIVEVPQAISANGRTIVGHGHFTGAWRITISSDCDFNTNGICDIVDLDALAMEIVAASHDPDLDLTGDGLVNLADRDAWLSEAGAENLASGNPYLLGDANLDGGVDGSDFGIWNARKFTTTGKWSQGDFDIDGVTDGTDFGIWNTNKFTSADSVTAVPEPVAWLTWIAVTAFAVARRQRHHQV